MTSTSAASSSSVPSGIARHVADEAVRRRERAVDYPVVGPHEQHAVVADGFAQQLRVERHVEAMAAAAVDRVIAIRRRIEHDALFGGQPEPPAQLLASAPRDPVPPARRCAGSRARAARLQTSTSTQSHQNNSARGGGVPTSSSIFAAGFKQFPHHQAFLTRRRFPRHQKVLLVNKKQFTKVHEKPFID